MKRLFAIILVFGVFAALGGCASVATVMQSDAPFEEKLKRIGAVIGEFFEGQTGSRADAVRKYNYAGTQEFLAVEDATLSPETAAPGQAVQASIQYVVLAPVATQTLVVVESRTLIGASDSLLLSKRDVTREQGAHSSTMKFTLPGDIAKGNYTLVTSISSGAQTKSVRRVLNVN